MSYNNGPKIVSDGLILYLDAGNTKSYVGSGTTWFDLSKNGNTGTLSGSPIYNGSGGGNIVFNGTTQKADCGNASSLQITIGSVSVWFNPDASVNTSYRGLITKQSAWGLFLYNNSLATYDWGNTALRDTGITPTGGAWNNAVMTFTETVGAPSNNANIYLNGNLVLTTTVKHSNQISSVQIAEANASQFFSGKIACASVYNKVLSASQVLQNYNKPRKKFGL